MSVLDELMATPYELGGRTVGEAIDCLGTVGVIAELRGVPKPDGWPSILEAARRGEVHTGFPDGWVQLEEVGCLQDGDVLVLNDRPHPGCAIVHEGRVWTSDPGIGVSALQLDRWTRVPSSVWRFEA